MHYSLRNHFGCTSWSKVRRLMWKLSSVYFVMLLILMQDRCTVYMERTICSEINLDGTDGTLDDVCHMKSRFGLFGDSVSLVQDRCTVCAGCTIV